MSDLKYYRANDLRQEICTMAGIDPGMRFVSGQTRGLRKRHLLAIADKLGLDAEPEWTLRELYNGISDRAGVEYHPNAGNPWRLGRPQLQAIHRALEDDG